MLAPPCLVSLPVLLLLALCACSSSRPADSAASSKTLHEVELPDLSGSDEGVRTQARQRYDAVLAAQKGGGQAPLAEAYGGLGMFLHAAEYLDTARLCYENAEQLAPRDTRWPYYLGLLLKTTGEPDQAIAAFRRALALEPGDVPALIWLSRLYIDSGKPEAAEPLLKTARERAPRSVPVLAAVGQVALAQRRYEEAVRSLEDALSIDSRALSLHAPLAGAYRALGQSDRADRHMKQWRNRDLAVADPRRDQLDLLLESGLSYELRGLKAMLAQDWPTAIAMFRQGLKVAPAGSLASRSLRHKLGTALYVSGDPRGAIDEFRELVRTSPPDGPDEWSAKSNYSLGVIMASGGVFPSAIAYLSKAVDIEPDYAEAHMALADALRRARRFADAVTHYAEVSRIDPANAEARFGYAVALVWLGRHADARDALESAPAQQPEQPMLMLALARVLATAPDPRARDGSRALALAQKLAATTQTTEVGETLAMALAETGDYSRAVAVQQDVIAAARDAGLMDAVAIMTGNLRLYQQGRPCRTPWDARDPVNQPGPPVSPGLAKVARAAAQ